MKIEKLIQNLEFSEIIGPKHHSILGLCLDSRESQNGFLYAAIKGTVSDGHDYIGAAIANGALAILCERLPEELIDNITYIRVEDSSQAIGQLAHEFYERPSENLKVIAITGTNGKTTSVSLLYDLFTSLGYTCGMLSTVQIKIADQTLPSTHTTPHAIAIHETLAKMKAADCTHCFMEASSHAIVQKRIAGLEIDVAGFTNLSHDHLDYHKTFADYRDAKKLLFDQLSPEAICISNKDDKNGEYMLQNTKASKYTYALQRPADFKCRIIEMDIAGMLLEINDQEAWFAITGDFNAYNLSLVYGIAFLLNEEHEQIITHLTKVGRVPGRFELMQSPKQGITGIVDYAHTPDALQNILNSINKVRTKNEKLITVFGCGGNRDAEKRPEMGRIASQLSDQVIITSDNPRDESPESIIKAIVAGVPPTEVKKLLEITDREQAIYTAIQLAQPKDIILVAGKGHEQYQEIQGVKRPFSDKEILLSGFNQYQK